MRESLRGILFAIVLLGATPTSASAQFFDFMDWLDRLSGPGPFSNSLRVRSVKIPLACVTETTLEKDNLESRPRNRLEWMPKCLGTVALVRFLSKPSEPPWGRSGGSNISYKRNILSIEANMTFVGSRENPLPYVGEIPEEQKKVKLVVLGLGARYLLFRSTTLYGGWDWRHFSSDEKLFESFDRNTRTLEIGWKLPRRLSFMTVTGGLMFGLGRFRASDFGAVGNFDSNDNTKAYIRVGLDTWWTGHFSR